MRYCTIFPCLGTNYYAKGFCKKHYAKMHRLGLLGRGYYVPRKQSIADDQMAVSRYLAGESVSSLSKSIGVHASIVRRALVANGVQIRQIKIDVKNSDQIIRSYVAGKSENALAKTHDVGRSTIRRVLTANHIKIRDNAEANKLMMLTRTPEENRRNSEAAHEAARNHVHTYEEKRQRAITRERKQLHISETEKRLACMLRRRGYIVTHQKAVGVYNCDLAVENVAIEIYGGGWHAQGNHKKRSDRRFSHILSTGWNVVIVWVDIRHYPLTASAADYIAAFIEHCHDVRMSGEYRVIRGSGTEFARGSDNLEMLTVKPTSQS
ncbi:hypothetical protein [Rhodococcus sp. HS-D2]|uniref:hypothetical protein n=1 Tax=Rhodococcus sp. HS-D2 TaxID=1384636 RepID=UPI000ADECED0|nr:hypothetical protein [Rhodococcus sp. HS-D2]